MTSPLVVTITMKTPWVPFDYYLCGGIGSQFAFVAEPNWLASGSQTNPIGTGPFVFQEWIPNDHFTATRNPNYWRTGLPYLDTITYKPIPDTDQILASLKSGAVDIMHTDTASDITALRANTSLAYCDDSVHVAGEPDMGCIHPQPVQAARSTTSSSARPWPTQRVPSSTSSDRQRGQPDHQRGVHARPRRTTCPTTATRPTTWPRPSSWCPR